MSDRVPGREKTIVYLVTMQGQFVSRGSRPPRSRGVPPQLTITRGLAGESHLLAAFRTSLPRGDSRLPWADQAGVRLVGRSAVFFRPSAQIRASQQPCR
jgi:hypothetical protein